MMTLDQGGDEGAMLYAQVGQHHLARATETSPKRSSGLLSCLSARPHDLAFWTGTRPRVVGVSPSIVPCVHSKRAASARGPRCVALSTNGRFLLSVYGIEWTVAVAWNLELLYPYPLP